MTLDRHAASPSCTALSTSAPVMPSVRRASSARSTSARERRPPAAARADRLARREHQGKRTESRSRNARSAGARDRPAPAGSWRPSSITPFDVAEIVDLAHHLAQDARINAGRALRVRAAIAELRSDGVDRCRRTARTVRHAGRRLNTLAQRFLRFAQPLREELRPVDGDQRQSGFAGECAGPSASCRCPTGR